MSYDHAKVQAWLARVPLPAGMSVFLECVGVVTATELWPEVLALVAEFKAASSWEQTNMLYGLKDCCVAQMDCLIHDSSRTARCADEARDPELQRILRERYEKSKTSTQNIPDSSMGCFGKSVAVCRICGTHFDHIPCPHGSIDPATGCNSSVEKANGQGH